MFGEVTRFHKVLRIERYVQSPAAEAKRRDSLSIRPLPPPTLSVAWRSCLAYRDASAIGSAVKSIRYQFSARKEAYETDQ